MSDIYTISKLVDHYHSIYGLPGMDKSNSYDVRKSAKQTYIVKITRTIKDVIIGTESLWDIIKPKYGWREISIDKFEKHCFSEWSKYLERIFDNKLPPNFVTDKENNLNKIATEDIDDHYVKSINRTWEQEERDFRHEDPSQISEEDFDKNLLKIMITGIYDIFYEPINESKLRKDMMNESIVKTDIEYLTYLRKKSIEDLENPRKYLGKLKKEKND